MITVSALVIFLGLCQGSYSTCVSCVPSGGNACTRGGSLDVLSESYGVEVNAHNCNNVYDKGVFQNRPEIMYPDAIMGQTYTLVMVDPDATNRTQGYYYLHWIRANIPGDDFRTGNLENSNEITSYQGPAPPQGTGLHRYMFYVYRHLHPDSRVTGSVEAPEREFFSLKHWLGRNARQGVRLCGPVSGVQFRSGF